MTTVSSLLDASLLFMASYALLQVGSTNTPIELDLLQKEAK
jgi:hypothetical protein